jgi:PhzF family phenazine biosynthesis protein
MILLLLFYYGEKMKIRQFQVDAFTTNIFNGNPAAVCILDKWLDETLMQKIAEENNLSETAFVVKQNQNYGIRWFTPKIEVDLCGHATLASAHVLFEFYYPTQNNLTFISLYSGILKVEKEKGYLILDFPIGEFQEIRAPPELIEGLGGEPVESYKGKTDYMFVYSDQEEIERLNPDFHLLSKSDSRGIIVTAEGNDVDFVSRFFAPSYGINEDPVTGSAHTLLTPYWIKRLNKQELVAIQLSKRKGFLKCKLDNDRVIIAGKAQTYLIGDILLPD